MPHLCFLLLLACSSIFHDMCKNSTVSFETLSVMVEVVFYNRLIPNYVLEREGNVAFICISHPSNIINKLK